MAKSFNARMKDRFARITSNINKQNAYIHETGMMLLRHAAPESLGGYGDCSLMAQFVRSLPASMRREMLIQWIAKSTPVVVKLGKDAADDACGFNAKYKTLTDADAKANKWDLEGADATPFYEMAKATPETRVYTLAELIKMVQGLSKRIEAKADDGEVAANDRKAARELAAKVAAVAA